MARTEQWTREKLASEPSLRHDSSSSNTDRLASSPHEIVPLTASKRNLVQEGLVFELSNQEYQVTEMLDTYATSGNFGGRGRLMLLKWTYDVLLGLYLFFTLWGYVAGKFLTHMLHRDNGHVFRALLCIDLPLMIPSTSLCLI